MVSPFLFAWKNLGGEIVVLQDGVSKAGAQVVTAWVGDDGLTIDSNTMAAYP